MCYLQGGSREDRIKGGWRVCQLQGSGGKAAFYGCHEVTPLGGCLRGGKWVVGLPFDNRANKGEWEGGRKRLQEKCRNDPGGRGRHTRSNGSGGQLRRQPNAHREVHIIDEEWQGDTGNQANSEPGSRCGHGSEKAWRLGQKVQNVATARKR